eukprot:TRINITY_DN3499_c0_g1_i1.p2 TRINITY_DN3499_c0_g1~~TRINITY_DN3499_c0_g1_i1.p2  ORF type:complete len:137 (+),score=38.83 TRINITY_DN3499_c0_g1_i1:52-462(+)
MSQLEVIVSAGNFKRMDPSAYGVTEREAYIVVKVGDEVKQSSVKSCPTLDPLWDETLNFTVTDPETQKVETTFFFGGKQIGLPCEFSLNTLKKNKSTFKGMPVVGGKIDFLLRALDFGEEESAAADDDDFDPFAMM